MDETKIVTVIFADRHAVYIDGELFGSGENYDREKTMADAVNRSDKPCHIEIAHGVFEGLVGRNELPDSLHELAESDQVVSQDIQDSLQD